MKLKEALISAGEKTITFIGGGGKTSAIFKLAEEINFQTIITTTTKMAYEELINYKLFIYGDEKELIKKTLSAKENIIALGSKLLKVNNISKVLGFETAKMEKLRQGLTDYIFLIEGDGANRKPLKGHGDFEPVIPSSTELVVVVVGIDALDMPLDEDHVHRPELLSKWTSIAYGEKISMDYLVRVLTNEAGYLKNYSQHQKYYVLINKIDDPVRLKKASVLAKSLVKHKYQRAILTSLHQNKVLGVIEK